MQDAGDALAQERLQAIPPDTPTWGRILFEAQNFIEFTPSMAIFLGLFIFLTVLSINYIVDGLRDALDPQMRSR
jgi:peptide/nickel transport system permease protein